MRRKIVALSCLVSILLIVAALVNQKPAEETVRYTLDVNSRRFVFDVDVRTSNLMCDVFGSHRAYPGTNVKTTIGSKGGEPKTFAK